MQLPYLQSNLNINRDFAYSNNQTPSIHSNMQLKQAVEDSGAMHKKMKSRNINLNVYKSTKDQLTDTRKSPERA